MNQIAGPDSDGQGRGLLVLGTIFCKNRVSEGICLTNRSLVL